MEPKTLNDAAVYPTDTQIFSIIGNHQAAWEETMSYLDTSDAQITRQWKYYQDGKSWLMRVMKKKSTVCWIRVLDDTFRIAFYFAERLEPAIMASALPEKLKAQYRDAKAFNKSRAIYIDVAGTDDLDDIKKLVDLKLANL